MGAFVFLGFFVGFCLLVIPQRFEYGRLLVKQYDQQNKIGLLDFIEIQTEDLEGLIYSMQKVYVPLEASDTQF